MVPLHLKLAKSNNIINSLSFSKQRGSFYRTPKDDFRRERFNSEGNYNYQNYHNYKSNNTPSNTSPSFNINHTPYTSASVTQFNNNTTNKNSYEEIEIDITNVKYSLAIKYKYSPQELMNHYLALKNGKVFDIKPLFNLDFPEITSEVRKEIDPKNFGHKGRDRSNTAMTFESYYTYNNKIDTHDRHDKRLSFNDFKAPVNSMKIPKNNPLANIAKTHNKFDDPNLKINPLTLSFNTISLKDDQNK